MKQLTIQPPKATGAARLRVSTPAYPWQLEPSGSVLPAIGLAPLHPTRREFLIGAGSLLVLGAAGCGGSGGGEGASGEKRTIEHKYGSTEISGTPRRVVTVGFSDQDPILALGVKPIAVTDWYGDYPHAVWPWAQDELGDARPKVLNRGKFTGATEPNFEAIAALEPDLVIGMYSGLSEQQYETLSEIAPTVPQSGKYPDWGMPWQEMTRMADRALGKRERAAELIVGIEGRFEEARQQHPEFEGKSAVVAERFETGFFVRAPQDPRSQFLTSLGFEITEDIAELTGDKDGAHVSEERLDLLDRDVLVWNAGLPPSCPPASRTTRSTDGSAWSAKAATCSWWIKYSPGR